MGDAWEGAIDREFRAEKAKEEPKPVAKKAAKKATKKRAKKKKVEEALRYNEGKPQFAYLLHYPHAMEALTRVLEQGAIKYEPLNWKLGNKPDEEYLSAAMRHLFAHIESEHDGDIGVIHLAQAVWNLVTQIELNMSEVATLNPDFDQDEFVARYS
jgi:hypothetical protein